MRRASRARAAGKRPRTCPTPAEGLLPFCLAPCSVAGAARWAGAAVWLARAPAAAPLGASDDARRTLAAAWLAAQSTMAPAPWPRVRLQVALPDAGAAGGGRRAACVALVGEAERPASARASSRSPLQSPAATLAGAAWRALAQAASVAQGATTEARPVEWADPLALLRLLHCHGTTRKPCAQ